MISFEDARKIVWETARKRTLETENIFLEEIPGRICAQELSAPLNIQPFDNAAMDGFAVRRSDLAEASEELPVTLQKTGIIAAGDPVPKQSLLTGSCVQIMTGAPVPPNAEAVVPVEQVKIQGDQIDFSSCPEEEAHIRRAGEDFSKGDVLLRPGQKLHTAHILPLATLGISKVNVYKKPRAAFLSTGLELIDDLSAPLKPGQIYNSNHHYALAFLKELGIDCIKNATIKDNPEDFAKTLLALNNENLDFIISSGAVSAGEFDFVKKSLEQAGAEILYHKIKIKPGKPNLLARLPNGTLYFGLPGNPVATAVGLRFLLDHAVRAMTGQQAETPLQARAMNKFSKRAGLQMFLKGKAESWEDGNVTVDIIDGQASFMVSPFLNMNMWVSVPEDIEELKAGDVADVYPLLPSAS